MLRRHFLKNTALGTAALSIYGCQADRKTKHEKPNIIFILADDMGYGDLGCYGQKKFATPNIDRLAKEGLRFTQCYAGSTVCAPSRSVLMTGQHTGHTRVRGNGCAKGGTVGKKGNRTVRRMSLTNEDITVGHVLQKAGYKTGLVGKWHIGAYDPNAGPLDRGFDNFDGWRIITPETYNPTYWAPKRYRNREVVDIEPNQNEQRGYYCTDMCRDDAINFIKENKDNPFFLYLAHTNPHSPLDAPDLAPYADKDWPVEEKTYAAMIHRLDQNIGQVMQILKDLNLDDKTIVFFTSDNGPRSGSSEVLTRVVDFFDSNGPLQGYKRDLYDGGIRVPMIARWPGKVPANQTSDAVNYFADFLPTAADLAGGQVPDNIDGLSIVPALLGKEQNTSDRFLYWEFFERGFQQAVRWKNWKALRLKQGEPLLLYDISKDISEKHNIADKHPDVIAKIEEYLKTARTDSPNYPITT